MKPGQEARFRGFKGKFVPPTSEKVEGGGLSQILSPQEKAGGRITIGRALEGHLASLRARNYSGHTLRGLRQQMGAFLRLSALTLETSLREVSPEIAEGAMAALARKYRPGTAWRYATSWVQTFRAFTTGGLLLENPFGRVTWPRRPRALPLPALSREEMTKLLRAPNLGLATGIRDRAILEVFYSTAIRLSEMAQLETRDIDFAQATLAVRKGKGGKARVVPLGEKAIQWLKRYLKEVRPRWAKKTTDALWIGQAGKPVAPIWIQTKVRRLGRIAKIPKPVTPHALRRTSATHLLTSGASPWAVKELLGHSDLTSLGRYVSLGAKELRETHEKTHPRAK